MDKVKKIFKKIGKFINLILIGMVRIYRKYISPRKECHLADTFLLFSVCNRSFTKIWTLKRIISCNKKDIEMQSFP